MSGQTSDFWWVLCYWQKPLAEERVVWITEEEGL